MSKPYQDEKGRYYTTPIAQAQFDLYDAADRVSRAWVGYPLPRPDHGPAMKALNDALRRVEIAIDEEYRAARASEGEAGRDDTIEPGEATTSPVAQVVERRQQGSPIAGRCDTDPQVTEAVGSSPTGGRLSHSPAPMSATPTREQVCSIAYQTVATRPFAASFAERQVIANACADAALALFAPHLAARDREIAELRAQRDALRFEVQRIGTDEETERASAEHWRHCSDRWAGDYARLDERVRAVEKERDELFRQCEERRTRELAIIDTIERIRAERDEARAKLAKMEADELARVEAFTLRHWGHAPPAPQPTAQISDEARDLSERILRHMNENPTDGYHCSVLKEHLRLLCRAITSKVQIRPRKITAEEMLQIGQAAVVNLNDVADMWERIADSLNARLGLTPPPKPDAEGT